MKADTASLPPTWAGYGRLAGQGRQRHARLLQATPVVQSSLALVEKSDIEEKNTLEKISLRKLTG